MTWHVSVIALSAAVPFALWQKDIWAGIWMFIVMLPVIVIAGK